MPRKRQDYPTISRHVAIGNTRQEIAPLCFLASISGGDLPRDEALAVLQELIEAVAKWTLITCGDEGAILAGEGRLFEISAAPMEVVDTLGVGDTFIARAIYGLVKGEAPEVLLKAAMLAATDTCRYFGAVGYPAPIALQGRGSGVRAPRSLTKQKIPSDQWQPRISSDGVKSEISVTVASVAELAENSGCLGKGSRSIFLNQCHRGSLPVAISPATRPDAGVLLDRRRNRDGTF